MIVCHFSAVPRFVLGYELIFLLISYECFTVSVDKTTTVNLLHEASLNNFCMSLAENAEYIV